MFQSKKKSFYEKIIIKLNCTSIRLCNLVLVAVTFNKVKCQTVTHNLLTQMKLSSLPLSRLEKAIQVFFT